MENKAYEFWKTLPSWARGVVAIGGIGIGYLAIRGFLNKVKKDASKRDQLATQKDQENELQDLVNNGVQPTYNDSQFRQWADELQNQFDGCDVSIRLPFDPTIFGNQNWSGSGAKLANIVLQLKNDVDFLSLSTAWGASRKYDQCGWFMGDFEGNFSQAVSDELSQDEINALNTYLSQKNIKYRF